MSILIGTRKPLPKHITNSYVLGAKIYGKINFSIS